MNGGLAILGAGGHGRVAADAALAAGWDRVLFFDDDVRRATGPWTVAGTRDDLWARLAEFEGVLVAVGDNAARLALTRDLAAAGARLATVIHPRATVSPHAVIGAGSVVFAGAVVNIGARLGQAVIVNTGALVDHDCVLGDGAHAAPGARLAGGVTVGAESWIGAGAVVREYETIGAAVTVGAGAVVVAPVADGLTVVGVPARPLKRRQPC